MAKQTYTLKDGTKITSRRVNALLDIYTYRPVKGMWLTPFNADWLTEHHFVNRGNMFSGKVLCKITDAGIAALRELGLIEADAPQVGERDLLCDQPRPFQPTAHQFELAREARLFPLIKDLTSDGYGLSDASKIAEQLIERERIPAASQPAPAGEAKFKVGDIVHQKGLCQPYRVTSVTWKHRIKTWGYGLANRDTGKDYVAPVDERILCLYKDGSDAQWRYEGRQLYAQAQARIAQFEADKRALVEALEAILTMPKPNSNLSDFALGMEMGIEEAQEIARNGLEKVN